MFWTQHNHPDMKPLCRIKTRKAAIHGGSTAASLRQTVFIWQYRLHVLTFMLVSKVNQTQWAKP